jgi:signal peptidase II
VTAPAPSGGPAARRPRVLVVLCIAVFVLCCDIASKTAVVATLSDRAPVRLLGGLLTLRVSRNAGAAFSIGARSLTLAFTAIAVGVIIFILRTSRRIRSLAWAITLGLLLGGATGNLADRLFRSPGPLRGEVVDWIQVPHWPVFNLADSSIVCGGALAVLLALRGVRIEGHGGAPAAAHPDGRAAGAGTEPDRDSPGGESGSGPAAAAPDGDPA